MWCTFSICLTPFMLLWQNPLGNFCSSHSQILGSSRWRHQQVWCDARVVAQGSTFWCSKRKKGRTEHCPQGRETLKSRGYQSTSPRFSPYTDANTRLNPADCMLPWRSSQHHNLGSQVPACVVWRDTCQSWKKSCGTPIIWTYLKLIFF